MTVQSCAPQPVTASAGVQSPVQFPSRRISSPACGVNSTMTVRRGTPNSSAQMSTSCLNPSRLFLFVATSRVTGKPNRKMNDRIQ